MRYFLEIEIRYSIINLNQTKFKEKKTHMDFSLTFVLMEKKTVLFVYWFFYGKSKRSILYWWIDTSLVDFCVYRYCGYHQSIYQILYPEATNHLPFNIRRTWSRCQTNEYGKLILGEKNKRIKIVSNSKDTITLGLDYVFNGRMK